MDSQPFCSIVIPALNEEAFIGECLRSLNEQTYPRDRYEIIVVDNGSTDSTPEIADQYADKVLSKPKGNVGAVRNFGIANAIGDIIVCSDSDCLFGRDWLETGVGLLLENPRNVYGGGLKPHTNPTWVEKYWLLNDDGKNTKQQKALMGSCIFVWKNDFEKAGWFREDVTSGEDSELSEALTRIGKKVVIQQSLSIVHLGNARTVREFSRRQIWHAENYVKNIKNSIVDPVFCVVSGYMLLIFVSISMFFLNSSVALFTLFMAMLLPALLTIKRLLRAGIGAIKIHDLAPVYALDLLYVNSRSIGVVKSLIVK